MSTTIALGSGQHADVYGVPTPSVLLWHGSTPNARAVLAPLSEAICARGPGVIVPDWDSSADDRGRDHLLASLRYARERRAKAGIDPNGLVVVGWSLGGVAALSLLVNREELGFDIRAAVLLAAPRSARDPLTGRMLGEPLSADRARVEVVHGRNDTSVDPGDSMAIASDLRAVGYDVTLTLLGADHGTIAMTRLDSQRYIPCDDEETRLIGESVSAIVARVAAV